MTDSRPAGALRDGPEPASVRRRLSGAAAAVCPSVRRPSPRAVRTGPRCWARLLIRSGAAVCGRHSARHRGAPERGGAASRSARRGAAGTPSVSAGVASRRRPRGPPPAAARLMTQSAGRAVPRPAAPQPPHRASLHSASRTPQPTSRASWTPLPQPAGRLAVPCPSLQTRRQGRPRSLLPPHEHDSRT